MITGIPPPLPVKVRPHTGEHYTAYLRRLALANHLRPSALRAYVNADAHAAQSFRLDRLAALSGRSESVLRRALADLPAPKPRAPLGTPPSRFARYRSARRPPNTPGQRLKRDLELAAEEMRYLDELALYDRIREERAIVGMTIPKLARNYMLGEDLVADILRGLLPRPPGRVRAPKPAPTLEPVKALINQMYRAGLPADRIWSELVDNHDAAISKNTLKLYLRALRHGVT